MKPIDPRLHALAIELLDEATDTKTARRYADDLAQQFANALEDFVDSELPRREDEREEAARDAYWDHRIDEARGK